MQSLSEYKKLYEERQPAIPASEAINWNAHTNVQEYQPNRPAIEVCDDLTLELKYYTNQPLEDRLCVSIFNVIYQELAKSKQLAEENMKHITGQNAWVNRDTMTCSLLVKNKALYFMKSKHVNQEFNYRDGNIIFRLYKTFQDIENGSDEFISSCVNLDLNTRIEFKFVIKYGNAGCAITIPEFIIVKKAPKEAPVLVPTL